MRQDDIARGEVPRLLERHRVTGRNGGPHDQIERLCRPGGDHHIVGATGNATRLPGPPRQGRAQRRLASGITIAIRRQIVGRGAPRTSPNFRRQKIERGDAGPKRDHARLIITLQDRRRLRWPWSLLPTIRARWGVSKHTRLRG